MAKLNDLKTKNSKLYSFFLYFIRLSIKYFCFSCHHGDNGCCVHCSPLEPYDEEYLKTQNMKHLSFHSYLRKMTAGIAKYIINFYLTFLYACGLITKKYF